MLQHQGARSAAAPSSGSPPHAPHDARLVLSLRALLSARGLAPEACTLMVKGVDAEGLVMVDVKSEGRSLSLRLRPNGYEVVRGVEASPPGYPPP
jgi:hypothetical protein